MLRVALIGYGDAANEIAAVSNRLSQAVLVGTHDVLDTSREFIDGHRVQLDAVAIRGPLAARVKIAKAAMQAGLHVMVTAPFGESVADTNAVASEARSAGVTLRAERTSHWHPYRRTIHDSLNADQLGEPGLLRIHRWLGKNEPKPQSRLDQVFEAVDVSDLGLGLPQRVYATSALPDGAEDASQPLDYLQIHFGYADRSSALIDIAHIDAPTGYHNVSLIGADGAAYADDHANMHLPLSDEAVSGVPGSPTGMQHWLAQLEDFASECERGDVSPQTESLVRTHKTALAVLQSLKDQSPVQLKEN